MLTILQSEDLPGLAELFAEQVLKRQDPFQAPLVLVPNIMLRTWLTYCLSQRGASREERIAINLDFRFLDEGLWDILAAMDPASGETVPSPPGGEGGALAPGEGDTPDLSHPLTPRSLRSRRPSPHGGEGMARRQPVRRLKREYRQWMIIQELRRALTSDPQGILSPLLSYLKFEQGDSEERAAGQSKRLWQLADCLARLFLEYESNRPDVIREWAKGGGTGVPEGSHERDARGTTGVPPVDMGKMPMPQGLPPTSSRKGRGKQSPQPTLFPEEEESQARNQQTDPMFEAQRSLYFTLFGLDGLCAKTNPKYLSLPQYFWALFQEPGKLRTPKKWPEVHVFTLPQLSRLHVHIFRELGALLNLHIYDLAAAGDKSGTGVPPVDMGKMPMPRGLFAQWGRAQELKRSLLAELVSPKCKPAARATAATVLGCVQANLQGRSSARDSKTQDASIQIGACPSMRREVETVYSNIVQHMLDANKTLPKNPKSQIPNPKCPLSLTDFAILVPDVSLYKPVIESVFGRVADSTAALDADSGNAAYERPLLTFNLLDSNAADDSVYAQAVEALLALGDEGFTRKELFHLLQNPCFLARHGLERSDVDVWLQWADALNIYRDGGAGYPACEDNGRLTACPTPDETGEVFAWRHGLRRLRLGRIMLPPRDSLNEQDAFRDLVPYADMESQSAEQVGRFCTLVSELIQSARELRASSHTAGEWQELLQQQLERFLEIPPDRQEEQVVRTALFLALRDLSELDTHLHAARPALSPKGRGEEFSFALVREMVRGSIISMPTHRGHLLMDGVTVASLRRGRIVPFKYIYVLGLGAGNFPGEETSSSLDLRKSALQTKDDLAAIDAGREVMREVLLSAGERIYLTYVARDLQKDEEFQPCAVVNELCTHLENEVFSPGSFTPMELAEIPLKGSSRKYLENENGDRAQFPNQWKVVVQAELGNWALSPFSTGLLCRPCFRHDRFLAWPAEKLQRELSARFAASSPLTLPSPRRGEGNRRLTLKDLADFLTDPVKAVLKHRLRLREEEEDDRALAEAEPTTTGFPVDYRLYAAAQQHCLNLLAAQSQAAEPAAPEQVREETLVFLDCCYARAARSGATPAAPFKLLDKRRYTEELSEMLDALQPVMERRGQASYVAFGTLGSRRDPQPGSMGILPMSTGGPDAVPRTRLVFLPPLALAGENGEQLEVHSNCFLVWDSQDGLCEVVAVAGSASKPKGTAPSKHVLEPLLFYLALRACKTQLPGSPRLAGEDGLKLVVLHRNAISAWTAPAWRPEDACAYLQSLACEYLYASRIEFLPFEEAMTWPELFGEPQQTQGSVEGAAARGMGILPMSTGGTPVVPRASRSCHPRGTPVPRAESLAESLRIKVEDSLAADFPHTSDLLKLIPVAVPDDPLSVARRRLKPVLDLQPQTKGKGDE